jgi:hypothetical protein
LNCPSIHAAAFSVRAMLFHVLPYQRRLKLVNFSFKACGVMSAAYLAASSVFCASAIVVANGRQSSSSFFIWLLFELRASNFINARTMAAAFKSGRHKKINHLFCQRE